MNEAWDNKLWTHVIAMRDNSDTDDSMLQAVYFECGVTHCEKASNVFIQDVAREINADHKPILILHGTPPHLNPDPDNAVATECANISMELGLLGWNIPVHDGSSNSYKDVLQESFHRDRFSDLAISPTQHEVLTPFQDFIPATTEGLHWLKQKLAFLETCKTATAKDSNRFLAMVNSHQFWEHGGVDDWKTILMLACCCKATVLLVADSVPWDSTTRNMEIKSKLARNVCKMYGFAQEEIRRTSSRRIHDLRCIVLERLQGKITFASEEIAREVINYEHNNKCNFIAKYCPKKSVAVENAKWLKARMNRQKLREVLLCDLRQLDERPLPCPVLTPSTIYNRMIQWAPGGMTHALFLRAYSKNTYNMNTFHKSKKQADELNSVLYKRFISSRLEAMDEDTENPPHGTDLLYHEN